MELKSEFVLPPPASKKRARSMDRGASDAPLFAHISLVDVIPYLSSDSKKPRLTFQTGHKPKRDFRSFAPNTSRAPSKHVDDFKSGGNDVQSNQSSGFPPGSVIYCVLNS